MKYTHTRFIVLLIFASVFAVVSQTSPADFKPKKVGPSETFIMGAPMGYKFAIISLEGHKYVAGEKGGVCHAYSCPCLDK